MTRQDTPYKVVDLFSGAGGFSIGFDDPESLSDLGNLNYDTSHPDPGFETILSVEYDEEASGTFELNFPDAWAQCDDIEEVPSFEFWSEADVVIGGPPCQGFSKMNSTKTEDLDDPRNELWTQYMRAVEDIEPDIFVLENVERFLSSEHGKNAYEKATELGYEVVVDELWANEHGVPQKRKRAFMIGSKKGVPFFPEPNEQEERTVEDAISDLPAEPTGEKWHKGRRVQEITKKRMQEIPEGGDRRDLPEELLPPCWKGDHSGHYDCYGRLYKDEPSITIRTGFYQPMKGRHLHYEANRTITPREGARLQTFPDTFEFASNAKTHVANQIGNAVPPKLAYDLSLAVFLHLDAGKTSTRLDDPEVPHDSMSQSESKPVHELIEETYD